MRGERYIASVAALSFVIALGGTACGSKPTCESEFKVSAEYPGDSQPNGVEIITVLSAKAEEVEVGFTDPGDNWHDQWLDAEQAHKIAMSIGPGAVRFRVRVKADQSSSICNAEPNTLFVQKSYQEAIKKDGATIPKPSKFHLDEHH